MIFGKGWKKPGRSVREKADVSRFEEMHRSCYDVALSEIRAGYKESHWMWFIFPQLKGLGYSYMAQKYGIQDLAEARAFMADPYLGSNLTEICNALLSLPGKDPVRIFGPVDAVKLKSSMTLFECVSEKDSVFGKVLDRYFSGQRDALTYRLLGRS